MVLKYLVLKYLVLKYLVFKYLVFKYFVSKFENEKKYFDLKILIHFRRGQSDFDAAVRLVRCHPRYQHRIRVDFY